MAIVKLILEQYGQLDFLVSCQKNIFVMMTWEKFVLAVFFLAWSSESHTAKVTIWFF